eukprot:TRINITY_DN322_c3_g1_i1.p1 TRINITY_DN322_c3_g1~~TRINITY_DN322_c3_g1_i1.p1  ORF type:complete len:601 (-),score=174.11 TRINITY_DN322_c3_g1_i1:564-2366(-)
MPSATGTARFLALIGVSLCFTNATFDTSDLGSNYETTDVMVPMSDTTKLYTVVFNPLPRPKTPRATVLMRTPYGTPSLAGDGANAVDLGFNAVMQDFRGRYNSEGSFEFWRDASGDGNDTMNWILRQEWSNGVIFTMGESACGIAQLYQPLARPPALRAQFAVVDTPILYRTIYQNGAYRHGLIDGWLAAIGLANDSAIVLAREADSSWWEADDLTAHWDYIEQAAIHVSGWYDIFMHENLLAFDGYQKFSSPNVQNTSFLIMLPTGHCQGGQISWPNVTFGWEVADNLAVAIFEALKDESDGSANVREKLAAAGILDVPRIWWYVMGPGLPGSTGNFWVAANDWVEYSPQPLYLAPNGALSESVPASVSKVPFVYDPSNPVPSIGGNNLMLNTCGPWDQLSIESRPDVVSFTTAPMGPTILNGPLTAVLFVSSSANDTDFTAKLTDVFPDGRSMLIQDGIVRMRWRNGMAAPPQFLTPGQIYEVEVSIWNTSYVLNSGHKLRLDVSSSNYPRFSVNPNNGLPVNVTGPLVVATNTIYIGAQYPSRLILPVVATEDMPLEVDVSQIEFFNKHGGISGKPSRLENVVSGRLKAMNVGRGGR